MRINRDSLLRIVRDTVNQRTRANRAILAVYLHGSLLDDNYLMGGTADIDLFFIHADTVSSPREIVHLSNDVHLDIAHHLHRDYRNTRQLRLHPWMGPTIKTCQIQFDPQHFLDFTQASVRGQYNRPEFVVERSRKQIESARKIWVSLDELEHEPGVQEVLLYLKALENAANSIASLSGLPLTERRFLQRLPDAFEAAQRPGLYPGLLGLLGAPAADADAIQAWIPAWQAAYQALGPDQAPARLHPARFPYYQKAFISLFEHDQPQAVLWPLLRTWSLAIAAMTDAGDHFTTWQNSLGQLGLVGGTFSERVDGLDAYLDMIEETLDNWAALNGVSLL
jgi:hypothetical protein